MKLIVKEVEKRVESMIVRDITILLEQLLFRKKNSQTMISKLENLSLKQTEKNLRANQIKLNKTLSKVF
jgi:two-component sensor histidine kinase